MKMAVEYASDRRNRLERPWLLWATVATILGLGWKCEINPRRNN